MTLIAMAWLSEAFAALSGGSHPRTLHRRHSQQPKEGVDPTSRPATSTSEAMKEGKEEVDEQLYSRQLFVYGKSAQKRLMGAHVLLYSANYENEDLLAEVAKNLALAGVGKISIRMNPPSGGVSSKGPQLIGESSSLVKYCSEINPLIQVGAVYDKDGSLRDFSPYTVVVACDADLATLGELNRRIRASGSVPLVAVKARGLAGYLFNDFGDHFDVEDVTGESGKDIPLRSASQLEEKGEMGLACIEEETFGLGIGDHLDVIFEATDPTDEEEVAPASITGLQVLSVSSPTSITVRVDDDKEGAIICKALAEGRNVMVKKAVETLQVCHAPLPEALRAPSFTQSNGCLSVREDRAWSLCLLGAFMSLEEPSIIGDTFTERSFRTALLANLISLGVMEPLKTLREGGVGKKYLDKVLRSPLTLHTSTCPATVSVLGPMASQEAIKAITHIHSPVSQFLMFESFDSLLGEDHHGIKPQLDNGGLVYGTEVTRELAGLKVFLVGSGAIGCELLKTLSLMGVATATGTTTGASGSDDTASSLWRDLQGGGIVLTDMDSIERSNLNRQLLFRQRHVGQPKALVAAGMAKTLCKGLKIHAMTNKVSPETEDLFDDAFWKECDVVITALDNVDARRFVDEKCVQYQKILLDSGTLGTKGNTQVVLPFLSESYSSSADPPEEAVPICTLKSFPYMSDHCVSWARALFTQCFNDDIETIMNSVAASSKSTGALETLLGNLTADDAMRVGYLVRLLGAYRTNDTAQQQKALIQWALSLFHKLFHMDVAQLLVENPPEKLDEEGQPFWGGSRRQPVPQSFDVTNPQHRLFLAQSVRLVCRTCGLMTLAPVAVPDEHDPLIAQILPLAQRELEQGHEGSAAMTNSNVHVIQLAQAVKALDPSIAERLHSEEFEKDDLSLGHVAFASAASNIRCAIYSLPLVDSLHVQRVAGKIVPAVATTTALVAGLVSLELVKVASERVHYRKKLQQHLHQQEGQEQRPISSDFTDLNRLYSSSEARDAEKGRLLERFRNTFANLARPLLAFAQPVEAESYPAPAGSELFTMWSVLEVPSLSSSTEAVTVQQLEAFLRNRLRQPSLELQSISLGDSLVYADFLPLHDSDDGREEGEEEGKGDEAVQVEQRAVQSLVLRMRAKGDSSDGEGGGRDDISDDTTLDPASQLEYLSRAHAELSSRVFLDLDVVCVNGEDGEDYRVPRVRLPLDATALAGEQHALKKRIMGCAARLQKETERESSQQEEVKEGHYGSDSSPSSSSEGKELSSDAPQRAAIARGVAGRAMGKVGQWARKALQVDDTQDQEQELEPAPSPEEAEALKELEAPVPVGEQEGRT